MSQHRFAVTAWDSARLKAAAELFGKRVRFAHMAEGEETYRVRSMHSDGMVEIDGLGGLFAPHLFVLVQGELGLPSAEDLDAVAADKRVADQTAEPAS
jgi:hypothetical protein